MKNLQKGFVVPLVIAVIAVLAIGGGIYIYKNKINTSVSTQETLQASQEERTVNCVNTKYGYELQYPNDWKVWASERAEERPATCAENFSSYIFAKDWVKTPTVNQIGLRVYAKGEARVGEFWDGVNSLDTYVSKLPAVVKSQTTLDSERAVLVTYDHGGEGLIVYRNESFYVFNINSVDSTVLNKFLSSFKFTK